MVYPVRPSVNQEFATLQWTVRFQVGQDGPLVLPNVMGPRAVLALFFAKHNVVATHALPNEKPKPATILPIVFYQAGPVGLRALGCETEFKVALGQSNKNQDVVVGDVVFGLRVRAAILLPTVLFQVGPDGRLVLELAMDPERERDG